MPQAFMLQPGQVKPCTQEIHALLLHFIKFWSERKYHWKVIIRKNQEHEAPVCSSEAEPGLQPSGAKLPGTSAHIKTVKQGLRYFI